ncbi:sensor histidine kinase [Cystobacter fuscus]
MKDAAGRGLPAYLSRLAAAMQQDLEFTRGEVGSMVASVEYLNEVVRTQQAYVGVSEAPEWIHLEELLDDALRMNTPVLEPLRVRIIKDYQTLPALLLQRSKVVQILTHLISNAASALSESEQEEKWLRLKLEKSGEQLLRISVEDNGEGIAPENLEKIFRAGFTTKEEGHGFGLHGSILTAKALGGSILARSEGRGRGAVFILELPLVSARA